MKLLPIRIKILKSKAIIRSMPLQASVTNMRVTKIITSFWED